MPTKPPHQVPGQESQYQHSHLICARPKTRKEPNLFHPYHPPTQKYETNPILAPVVIPSVGLRSEAQRPKVEGSTQSPSPKAIPNKQIQFTIPPPKCAKQTQSLVPPASRRPPQPKNTKRTQFRPGQPPKANSQQPLLQNKPNFLRSQISDLRFPPPIQNMQNKPNYRTAGVSPAKPPPKCAKRTQSHPAGTPIPRNEPNFQQPIYNIQYTIYNPSCPRDLTNLTRLLIINIWSSTLLGDPITLERAVSWKTS